VLPTDRFGRFTGRFLRILVSEGNPRLVIYTQSRHPSPTGLKHGPVSAVRR